MCGAVCVILNGWSGEIWREVVLLFVLWRGFLLGSVCIVGGYLLWSGGVVQVVRLVEKVFGGGNC